MQPPIPSPETTCPSCGHVLGTARMKYCPNCGAGLTSSSSAVSGLKIFGAICLGVLALPSAGMGACFLVLSGLDGGVEWQMAGIALGLLLFAALLVLGIVKLVKH